MDFLEDSRSFYKTLIQLNKNFETIREFLNEYSSDDELVQSFLKMIDASRKMNPVKKGIATVCRYDYMLDEVSKKFM